ncbi:MAG: acyltransferase domain-containing protein, partial [Chloroflexaceae bacterium]|nr:acyltransferase domain-containing protein [Chloroflexaceae bacterium]
MRPLQLPPIAIIGMAGIFPQARNLREYWHNILQKIDCIIDVPPSRWNRDDYYDPDPKAPDKTYSRRGGFLPDIDFDPLEFGLPPNILEVTDVSQLLGLVVAKEAMEDAGYSEERDFARDRTGVILGVTGGQKLITPLIARMQYPIWEKALRSSGVAEEDITRIVEKIKLAYVKWEENAFPGLLGNVIAGRITNRLNLGGTNCVVDAACASSMAAMKMSVSELLEGRCDMVITGGVDTDNSILMYMCFSKTPAFSQGDQPRPFDKDADGMMVGEGLGMMVLKRLEDAKRDGDRIYAVVRGIGTSSDGRHKSIYAPHAMGQARALRAAYENAGFAPETVGLIEAHGTGTVAGDMTEFNSLRTFFADRTMPASTVALGSVKSQIGHTKATAGAASLIKTVLALHHKVLPPTINVSEPNPKFKIEETPFYINTETRPWLRAQDGPPRRAGVSSFGFGGTNFHIVLEEYTSEHTNPYRLHDTARPVVLSAATPAALLAESEAWASRLNSAEAAQHYATLVAPPATPHIPQGHARLGFVVATLDEARTALQNSIPMLRRQPDAEQWQHPRGIFYRQHGLPTEGRVVALFSGQGSQYLEMGRELTMNYPILRHAFAYMDSLFTSANQQPLSQVVYPAPAFTDEQREAQTGLLQQTSYAQPAIGVLSAGLYKLLQQAGLQPAFLAGHSFGELTALWAAGAIDDGDYFMLVKARGQAMAPLPDQHADAGTMLAVSGNLDLDTLQTDLQHFPQVQIANWNSPRQVVLAGPTAAVHEAHEVLRSKGYSCVLLPVAAAFHTALVAHAQHPFAQAVAQATFHAPALPVYANATGQRYPTDPATVQQMLARQMLEPVLFQRQIETIYNDGGTIFVEFGPRSVLTNLVKDILGNRPHLAIALNESRKKDSDRQLQDAIVQLRVAGVPLHPTDKYYVEPPARSTSKRKGVPVRLSGSNYVSDKTRRAFEEALNDGHRVGSLATPAAPAAAAPAAAAPAEQPAPPVAVATMQQLVSIPAPAEPVAPAEVLSAPAAPAPEMPHPVVSLENGENEFMPIDYTVLLASLERSLKHFSDHQAETLQIHEQYLQQQAEFSQTFFQFMQQQQQFLMSGHAPTPAAIESLSRSAEMLRTHQAETLRVHEHYLTRQDAHTREFSSLCSSSSPRLAAELPPRLHSLSHRPPRCRQHRPRRSLSH